MQRVTLLSLGVVIATSHLASGQTLTKPGDGASRPMVGGTGGLGAPVRAPMVGGITNSVVKVHLAPTGKPCVRVEAYSKAQTINPNIFEHVISATNNCSQRIKMEVCYYKTQHCILVDLPPYDRKQTVLGIYPALKEFRYEYTEKF